MLPPDPRSGSSEYQYYLAYCFDEAVIAWGNYVTDQLERVEAKTPKETERRRQSRFQALMAKNDPEGTPAPKGMYRDPMSLFK